MKIKNIILRTLIIMIAIIIGVGSAVSLASDSSTSKYLALSYFRYTYSNGEYTAINGYGYNVVDQNHKPIFQVYETDEATGTTISGTNYYCLNATAGETWLTNSVGTRVEYNSSFNLDDESDLAELANLTTANNIYSNIANSQYLNQILWILDNMYVPDTSATDETNNSAKLALLAQAGIVYTAVGTDTSTGNTTYGYKYEQQDGYSNYSVGTRTFYGYYNYYDTAGNRQEIVISDDIVETAQQAALWYFTNSESEGDGYDVSYDETNGLKLRLVYSDGTTNITTTGWQSLTTYSVDTETTDVSAEIGSWEEEQAAILCAYLIEAANKNASTYSGTTESPVSIAQSTTEYETISINDSYYYVVGPITITENSDTAYTLENKILVNGEEITGAYLSDQTGTATNKTVQESVGTDFYVAIPVNSISTNSIKISFEGSYTTNKKTLWVNNTSEEQPIVEIKSTEEEIELPVTVVIEGEFDLSLRKTISKIKNSDGNTKYIYNEAGNLADRTINYVATDIATNGTATYNHRKDPVVVETGDIVTYSITVYNEGDIDGYVTTIVDKLPEGLALAGYTANGTVSGEYVTSEGIRYSYVYDPTTNEITFTNESKNILKAYEGGDTLSSETIEINCEVVATAAKNTNTYLTNIAYISGEYNAETNEEVTTDRDSSTTNSPSASQETTGDTYNGYTGGDTSKDVYSDTNNSEYFPGQEDDDDFEIIVIEHAEFDLALQKYISSIYSNGTTKDGRTEPTIDTSKLASGEATTATYTQDKSVITVNNGDYVIYTLTVYNEGDIDGYVDKITDNIPTGLEFLYIAEEYDSNAPAEENAGDYKITACNSQGDFYTLDVDEATYNLVVANNSYWSIDAGEGDTLYTDTYNGETTISVTCDVEAYLGGTNTLLKAFDSEADDGAGSGLSSVSVSLVLRVADDAVSGVTLRNEAAITEAEDSEGNKQDVSDLEDRDSQTDEWKGKDDHNNYQDDEDYDNVVIEPVGTYDLILVKEDENGEQLDSTATFTLNGTEITVIGKLTIADDVEINSTNVDTADTYVIKETVAPDGYCEFDGTITINVTKKLAEDGTKYEVDKVTYVVTNDSGEEITTTDANVYLSEDGNIYVEVIDYEEVPDLALTKFIVAVSEDTSIDDGEWLTKDTTSVNAGSSTNPFVRATSVDTTELRDNADCHDATYTMVKDPLTVPAQSYVLYNIRIYNEGDMDVYAGEITDYLPTYLDFVDCDFNTNYGWTVDSDGKTIRTTYLAYKEGEEANLLKAFDKQTDDGAGSGLDYRDVQVLCRINDNAPTNTTIVNTAEITEYQDEDGEDLPEDIDSTPDNVNETHEDDDDYEQVLIQTFDLSLLKYVTTVYVTVDGQTQTIETGNVGDENDTIPKVEINRKKIDSTTVIFEYTIKITNEGDIEGYATEITDYVPEGLKYYAEDNEDGVWTDEGNNVISTTELAKTLLQPGESAEVTVRLRWINGSDNLGLKTNIAEISEDYNDYDVPDKDSTPDNQVQGEDDIDEAQVLLSISTGVGKVMTYIGAATLILIVFAAGIISIKRFVL